MLRFAKRILRWMVWRVSQNARIGYYRIVSNVRQVEGSPLRLQPVYMTGAGIIIFDQEVKFGVPQSPGFLSGHGYLEARGIDAKIQIGAGTWVNNQFSVIAEKCCISIGKNCLIGHDVIIYDSDFHPLEPSQRLSNAEPPKRADVTIGDNVFLGSRSIILKGTKIADGCVVAAGAVVAGSFSSAVLIAGNPAKAVRDL